MITDTSCHCLPVCGGKGDGCRWRQVDESYKNQESGGIFWRDIRGVQLCKFQKVDKNTFSFMYIPAFFASEQYDLMYIHMRRYL